MLGKKKKRKGDLLAVPVIDNDCGLDAYHRLEVVLTQNEVVIGKLQITMKTHKHNELVGFEKVASFLKHLGSYSTNELEKISDKISHFEDRVKHLKDKLQKNLEKSEDKVKVVKDLTALKNALNGVVDKIRIHLDELEDFKQTTKRIKREENRAAQKTPKKKDKKEKKQVVKKWRVRPTKPTEVENVKPVEEVVQSHVEDDVEVNPDEEEE